MTTKQVVQETGLTPRMLQNMDVTGIVSPVITKHSRIYTEPELQLLRIIAQLKEVGIPINFQKKFIAQIKRRLALQGMPAFIVGVDERLCFTDSEQSAVHAQIEMLRAWAKLPRRGAIPPRVFVVATEQA